MSEGRSSAHRGSIRWLTGLVALGLTAWLALPMVRQAAPANAAERLMAAMHAKDWPRAVDQLSWSNMPRLTEYEGQRHPEVWGARWELQEQRPSRWGSDHPGDRVYRLQGRDGQARMLDFNFVASGKVNELRVDGRRAFQGLPTPAPFVPTERYPPR